MNQVSIISKYDKLIVLLMLFVSDDTILFGTNQSRVFLYIKYLVLSLILFSLIFKQHRGSDNKVIIYSVIMCVIILLSSIVNNALSIGLYYKCVILLSCAFFVKRNMLKVYAGIFESFIYVVAIVSLVGSAFVILLPSFVQLFPKVINTVGGVFYNLLLFVPEIRPLEEFRNNGFFREPGVYHMYLNLALVFHLYFSEKVSYKRVLVFIITIITTLSTTGFICLAGIGLMIVLKQLNNNGSVWNKVLVIGVSILLVLVLYSYTDLLSAEGVVFGKIGNEENDSYIARAASITTNISIWQQNPFLGGSLRVNDIFESITYNVYGIGTEHNTNTLLCELAMWGIFYFIIMMMGLFRFSFMIGKSKLEGVLFLIIILAMSVGERLIFSPFFYMLVFYGLSNKRLLGKSSQAQRFINI